MTRNSRTQPSRTKISVQTKVASLENTYVFLFKDEVIKHDSDNIEKNITPDIVSLRHPGTKERAMFLFSSQKGTVYEVLSFSEPKRSWFINDSVKSDGTLHLSTPIDPLFLVLPYIREQCDQLAIPLDQVLKDNIYPETNRLININSEAQLSLIADQRGSKDLQAFKFNEEKTLSWLKIKVLRIVDVLKNKNIHVGHGAVSATFVRSSKTEPADEDSYLKYAHGIISDYLVEDLSKKLFTYLGIKEEISHKRKASATNHLPNIKKIKSELDISISDGTLNTSIEKPEKPKNATAKEKALAKAASGSKSIASFFKKK